MESSGWAWLWAFLIGMATGLFLAFGGAVILRRTLKLMEVSDKKPLENLSFSAAQAFGLATLWVSKLLVAALILYFAQKWGFSIKWLGSGLPLGILLGVFLSKR